MKRPKILVVGSFVMDQIVTTRVFPRQGQTILAERFNKAPGVMVMFAPGTTRMRFSVPPFGCSSRMITEQPEAALSS